MRITRTQGNSIIVITRMSFNLMLKEHEKRHKGFYKWINVLIFQNQINSLYESKMQLLVSRSMKVWILLKVRSTKSTITMSLDSRHFSRLIVYSSLI